jgi:DNA polymerase III subunit delta
VGADSLLAEEALERLLAEHLGDAREDAVTVVRGEETTWARLLETARTGSLFAPQRALVVRSAEQTKGEDEAVTAYLESPTPGVLLVLMAAKPDKRKAVWKRILERAAVTPADPLKGRALRAHVQDRLRRRKLALSDDGLEELLERVGQDLRRLVGEIDKLEAFAAGRKEPLTADDVAAVSGRGLTAPLYKLSDAFGARRTGALLTLMEDALEDGLAPLLVLATLHRSLRQLRGAKALQESRASQDQIVSRLGVLPFKVRDVLEAARRWSDAELAAALRALDVADRRIKLGAEPKSALLAAVSAAAARRPEAAISRARSAR